MNLIIVESPTKAKTLTRFLGGDFDVEATYGHVRDLPAKKLGIDVKKHFEPDYVQTDKQKEKVKLIEQAAKKAKAIYLATDPDREGEAIAWHVASLMPDSIQKKLQRIVFHQITSGAVKEALEHARGIDDKLVDAQQARRVVDRLVGYKLSPLLWKKVRKGLSAGRVQSVAVRLIVEREREIEAFVPEEYWHVTVQLETEKKEAFWTTLVERNEEKLKINNGEDAQAVETHLRGAKYKVGELQERQAKRTPPAPFTTSTLQQNAANRLGWSAKKTMQVAQGLYEEGVITYHRTDSTNLAVEAVNAAREYVTSTFGKEFSLEQPRLYKTKSKVAQEAHEAIRPVDVTVAALPVDQLNKDSQKLYELIWKRFLASQMAEAVLEEMKVKVVADAGETKYGLEAKGVEVVFEGWLKLYGVKSKGDEEGEDELESGENVLPELIVDQALDLLQLTKLQKFTQPPARYNDASLIKALEEMGIGRPSTYAPIISTIQDRQYVEKIEKRHKPTPLGIAVNDFLVTNFPKQVDYQFTAKMEDDLDEIANGEKKWKDVVGEFYSPFEDHLEKVADTTARVKVEVETTGDKCPECNEGDVVVRIGKFGRFLACSRYPDCKYKANYQNKIGVPCPKCGGDIIMRKTRSKKTFYGCSNYPKCDFASWTKPSVKGKEEARDVTQNADTAV